MRVSSRKFDLALALAIVFGFFLLGGSSPFVPLEGFVYDLGLRFNQSEGKGGEVAVIAVDEASLEALGPWPWPRDRLAGVLNRLNRASVVGITLPLDHPEHTHELRYLEQVRTAYQERRGGHAELQLLERLASEFDSDRRLAASLKKSFLLAPSQKGSNEQGVETLGGFTPLDLTRPGWTELLPGVLSRPYPTAILARPLTLFSESTGGLAPLSFNPDAAREPGVPLVVHQGEADLATLALRMAAGKLGNNPVFREGKGVALGQRVISTDWSYRAYPRFPASNSAIKVYSFSDVSAGKVSARRFSGKPVLIGLTAPDLVHPVRVSTETAVAPVIAEAQVVSALLGDGFVEIPDWAILAQLVTLAGIVLFLGLVLPAVRISTGGVLALLLLFLLVNVQFIFISLQSVWIPLVVPAAALMAGTLLFLLKNVIGNRLEAVRVELSETNRLLGQTLQAQGQLDQAFERYRRCRVDPHLLEQLYNLGLDFERKRQFNKAVSTFEYLEGVQRGYRDSEERLRRNREVESRLVLGSASPTGTLIMEESGVQKPMLGRYQVERELGRGAMGLVYLGRDPKIGRTVAIKTLALAHEFEGVELQSVKERFFREAETAGRLNHPNIVTIYDVGEDQELAYIAMDYLKGENLAAYCRSERLLPVNEIATIVAQVADALDYAHRQSVVHRDIKPANIIYERETETVKVTDFGVACLTDSTKTRTGTILGSPSYMSPEQMAGNRIDGRSDIFSLGITLFQLLSGELPFSGDSFPTLMYKIVNEKHPDVRRLREEVPTCLIRVINKALQKDPQKRFQTAEAMANALRGCGD